MGELAEAEERAWAVTKRLVTEGWEGMPIPDLPEFPAV